MRKREAVRIVERLVDGHMRNGSLRKADEMTENQKDWLQYAWTQLGRPDRDGPFPGRLEVRGD